MEESVEYRSERELQTAFIEQPRKKRYMRQCCTYWKEMFALSRVFPVFRTLQNYKASYISPDFVAGLSESFMALPMGMSYALLAKLDPVYGLYCGVVFPGIYIIFGTSIHVSVGVSAVEAVMVGSAVDTMLGPDVSMKLRVYASVLITFILGVLYVAMRIASLGVVADFLSDSVLSGFATACVFVIGTKQLSDFLGIDEIESDWTLKAWWEAITNIHRVHWVALAIGSACLGFMVATKFVNRRFRLRTFPIPGPLVVIICATALVWGFKLDETTGLGIVGEIPAGLPKAKLPFGAPLFHATTGQLLHPLESDPTSSPDSDYVSFNALIAATIPIALMYFVIHVSIVKTIGNIHNYKIDANQELLALGITNIFGSFFQCFPCASSVSRTSVVSSCGARTVMHGAVCVVVMIISLLLLTPTLYYLPKTCLSAVVLAGVGGMSDFRTGVKLHRVGGLDFILWWLAFVVTICLGVIMGVIISLLLSIVWLLRNVARPSSAVLGRLPGTNIYRNIERFPAAVEHDGIKIFRFDANLFFSNAEFFQGHVTRLLDQYAPFDGELERSSRPRFIRVVRVGRWLKKQKRKPMGGSSGELSEEVESSLSDARMDTLIIDASSINEIDCTALAMLRRLIVLSKSRKVKLLFANWKGPVRDFLLKAGFYGWYPEEWCFLSIVDAVTYAQNPTDSFVQPKGDGLILLQQRLSTTRKISTTTLPALAAGRASWRDGSGRHSRRGSRLSSRTRSMSATVSAQSMDAPG